MCLKFIRMTAAHKMTFSIEVFLGKVNKPTVSKSTFTEEILNGKLHFLCSAVDSFTFSEEMLNKKRQLELTWPLCLNK